VILFKSGHAAGAHDAPSPYANDEHVELANVNVVRKREDKDRCSTFDRTLDGLPDISTQVSAISQRT
jgi:hypothetical protein